MSVGVERMGFEGTIQDEVVSSGVENETTADNRIPI